MPEQKYVCYGGQTMELPAGMSLEEAKAQMARFFPELAEPHVETQKDGDKTTYVFSKQAGRKGSDSVVEWICLECEGQPHFTHPEFLAHAQSAHGIETKTAKGNRSLSMHLDGAKFFEDRYDWEFNGLHFLQMIRTQRTGEDAIWWSGI